jgi:hypothetical protein
VTVETRAHVGGPRCAGCRALRRPRPGLVPALALTVTAAASFTVGRLASRPAPLAPAFPLARIPAAARDRATGIAAPPAEPPVAMHPCGARTKRGTPCKRLVRGPGRCYQHGGAAAK